jgi:D-alanyl-D-alanine carboxypeptidase
MKHIFYSFKRRLCLVALIIITASTFSFTQGFSPQTVSRLQHIIDSFQTDPANPYVGGMSAAIKVDGLAFWQGATGHAARNVDGNNNILPGGTGFETSTISRMYSVTKTFTAALTLELAKEGAFNLDQSVITYIPFLNVINAELNPNVTIRQLLAHESGYSSYSDEMMLQIAVAFQPTHEWTPFEALSFVHQINVPGAERRYSNTNYIVLGAIIEIATAKSLQQHFRERFFTPLELNSMYFDAREPQPAGTSLAAPHDNISPFNPIFQFTGQPTFPDAYTNISAFPFTAISTLEFASGALITNISDMAEWGNSLFGGRATSRSTIDDMVHSISPTPDVDGDFLGYGVFRTTRISSTDVFIGHDGNAPGYRSVMFYQPERKMTVAIVTNYRGAQLYEVAKALYNALPEFICGNDNKKEKKVIVSYNGNDLCVDRDAAAVLIQNGGYLGGGLITNTKVTTANAVIKEELIATGDDISLYPNPASGRVSITFKAATTGKANLSLYDLNGRLIAELYTWIAGKQIVQNITLETGKLKAGIYLVRLQTRDNSIAEKLIVTK